MADNTVEIVLKATNKASGPISAVQTSLRGLEGMAKGTISNIGKLATAAATGVGLAAVGAVTGLTAAVAQGVAAAADMEQQVANLAATMGITYDEAAPLEELISNLALDPQLVVGANEAAEAIQALAANGLTMQEILDGAARSTVLLANSTGADFSTAANVATDAMSLFNINAAEMERAVDGISGVTVASKFGINDYALALAQGGGVAAAVGVSFADFNTTIAAISPSFAGGSDAGTSFKTMLQRLIPQSGEALTAMQALGLATEDGRSKFFDATGQMLSMQEITGLLQGALGGLSDEQRNAALSTIFGSDAMRAASALATVGATQFGVLAGEIGNVSAAQQAITRQDTLQAQWAILTDTVAELSRQIGAAFLPLLKDVAQWTKEAISVYGPRIVEFFGGISAGITTFWNTFKSEGILAALNQMWASMMTWINDPAKQTAMRDWLKMTWDGFAKWAGALWTDTLVPALAQLWSNLDKWIDDNLPDWKPWKDAFVGFTVGVTQQWSRDLPVLTAALEEFARRNEFYWERIAAAWARVFGDGSTPGSTGRGLGAFVSQVVASLGIVFTGTLDYFSQRIVLLMEIASYAVEALRNVMSGNWAGATSSMWQVQARNTMLNNLPGWSGGNMMGQLQQIWSQAPTPAPTYNNTYNLNYSGYTGGPMTARQIWEQMQMMQNVYGAQ